MRVRRLDADHDMTFGNGADDFAADQEAVAQNVRTRLYLIKGEWFLDTGAGVPYVATTGNTKGAFINDKPRDAHYADSIIKKTILETEGVASLDNYSSSYDAATRRYVASCTVTTIFGTTESIKVNYL